MSCAYSLKKYIQGQSEGIDTIVNALSAWEFQHHDTPLVLALTGPTGESLYLEAVV